jgi:hypothetical protein
MTHGDFNSMSRAYYVVIGALVATAMLTACSKGKVAHDASADANPIPNLIAFVGRRLNIEHVEPKENEFRFDDEFRVRVEVLEVVFGKYESKEMEFSSYIHIGRPAFQDSEFGLVYISKDQGQYFQQKYLFQPVSRTSDGRWAGCGDPYSGMPDEHKHGVQAVPITFTPPFTFDIEKERGWQEPSYFQAPYFRIEHNVATCLMGNYPPELFRVMAEGYLKARGVFGPLDK